MSTIMRPSRGSRRKGDAAASGAARRGPGAV